jgi:hypothetical protein
VEFERMPAIWGRDERSLSDAKQVVEERLLGPTVADVLDHRITEDEIERVVVEREWLVPDQLMVRSLRKQAAEQLAVFETGCFDHLWKRVIAFEEVTAAPLVRGVHAEIEDTPVGLRFEIVFELLEYPLFLSQHRGAHEVERYGLRSVEQSVVVRWMGHAGNITPSAFI